MFLHSKPPPPLFASSAQEKSSSVVRLLSSPIHHRVIKVAALQSATKCAGVVDVDSRPVTRSDAHGTAFRAPLKAASDEIGGFRKDLAIEVDDSPQNASP